ncbi:hypothetical protein PC110_g8558 [Phytophthora cactorum]|uniref:Integrase catalytic domain-containing protein n=1 Tax=Phytophthora cactorum TaxID=29920 RepID=A0A329SES0_9STRA|nr:hypothetical protein PC110_g8558 [Phytophthora cactorum]
MPVQELSGPLSLLVVNALGPLVTTPRGNKFILVFTDYFTRWAEAFPVKRLDTVTFIDVMANEVISIFAAWSIRAPAGRPRFKLYFWPCSIFI